MTDRSSTKILSITYALSVIESTEASSHKAMGFNRKNRDINVRTPVLNIPDPI